MPIPLPPWLRNLDIHSALNANTKCPFETPFVLCVYNNNNLFSFDMSTKIRDSDVYNKQTFSTLVLRGFHKLVQLNVSNNNLPSFHQDLLVDMPSRKHVNISGNNVSTSGNLNESKDSIH